MIRKWMSILLALLLAVMAPVCALADRQNTLTVIPGDALSADEAIADLSEVLSLTYVDGAESIALSAALAEQDMLTIALSADETGLYVYSDLLSDDVLYVTWEDSIALLSQMAAAEMGEEYAAVLQQNLEMQLDQLLQLGAAPVAVAVSPEESMEEIQKMFADDPAMLDYVQKTIDGMTIEEGSFADPKRDMATGRIAMNMTNEDLLVLCDSATVRTSIEEAIKAENPELTGDDLAAAVDSALEEVRQIYTNMEMEAGMSVYTVDDGEEIVGMELYVPMTMEMDGVKETFVLQADYNRLTMDNGVSFKANLETGFPDEEDGMISLMYDHYKGADELYTSDGMLALLAGGQQFTITYDATTEGRVRTRLADVYYRDGAAAIVEPAASERPLITFKVLSQDADSDVIKTIEKADSTTAVNLLALNEAELNELMMDIQVRFTQIYSNVLSNLPASVLRLLMGSME